MEGQISRVFDMTSAKSMTGMNSGTEVEAAMKNYAELYKEDREDLEKKRLNNYSKLVNVFYDLVTTIYEYGWGQSFHFSSRHKYESFEASIARSEMYAALVLQLTEGKKCLDIGSGIGGPMRTIARFSKAHVTGINNNDFQIQRTLQLNKEANLVPYTACIKGDFTKMPFEADTFDAAYQFEAIEHAPDKKVVYSEIFRILKPGGLFAGFEWCVTPKYDTENKEHKDIIFRIIEGNGVAKLETFKEEMDAMLAAGFEIVDARDLALESEIPWYEPLSGKWSWTGFRHTRIGRYLTHQMVWSMETVGLAPKGVFQIHSMLMKTAIALVQGGEQKIFTPMFFTILRKPLEKTK